MANDSPAQPVEIASGAYGTNAPSAAKVELPVPRNVGGGSNATNGPKLLARAPIIDRTPIVIGQNLSLAYISVAFRLRNQGWRWQFVDVTSELLEHDPHARGVVRQRLLPILVAPLQLKAAKLPPKAAEGDKDRAQEIADFCQYIWDRIPAKTQAIGRLLWGIPLGLSACETEWERNPLPGVKWGVAGLHFIHSRRLNLSNPYTWDVYVYDQGPSSPGFGENNAFGYGLRIADYPAKFICHNPALNQEYSVRDGELMYISFYMALKRMIVRASAQDFERTIRPWVVAYFNREEDADKKTVATDGDIAQAYAAVKALGLGSLSGVVLPDAIKVEILKHIQNAGSPREFVEWLDEQMSVSLLGQTYTTKPQERGTHEAADTAQSGTEKLNVYDAGCLADTLKRDLFYWVVALNFSEEDAKQFTPNVDIATKDVLTPEQLATVAKIGTALDIPIDARAVGEQMGLPVIAETEMDDTARTRVVTGGAGMPVEPDGSNDPNSPNYDPAAADAAAAGGQNQPPGQSGNAPPGTKKVPGGAPGKPGKPPFGKGKAPAAPPAAGKSGAPDKGDAGKDPAGATKNLTDHDERVGDAALVVITDPEGRILTVSRPEPPHEQAVPGGLVDPGETPLSAAVRELHEECDITVTEARHAYDSVSPTDGRIIHVFVATAWNGSALAREADTKVAWLTPDELLAQATLYAESVREMMRGGAMAKATALADKTRTTKIAPESDKKIADAVFDQLAEDYPEEAILWVKAAAWVGPLDVPLDEIDYSNERNWAAWKDHEHVDFFVKRIGNGNKKPIILVKEPKTKKFAIIDGHHRALAYEKRGTPACAYVGTVATNDGPWDEMHDEQFTDDGTKLSSRQLIRSRQKPRGDGEMPS